jgi:chemotaxis protein methyltransferase CheR
MSRTRALVFGASVEVRRGVADLLADDPAFEALTAPTARGALAKAAAGPPELLLLDAELPLADCRELPADLPLPVCVVQHMPPQFTGPLAARLTTQTGLAVREAADGDAPTPGGAWIAPGDRHLRLTSDGATLRLRTDQGPPENSCRPSADVLFRSAADACGAGVLAVVLTGMGQDGLRGCACVRQAGGMVLVQDEASSVVWGMPGSVARAGLADAVLPLGQIGPEVARRVRRGPSTVVAARQPGGGSMPLSPAELDYVRGLVKERSANVLEGDKAYLAEARLLPVAQREGFRSVSELVAHLSGPASDGLRQRAAEAMTINETSFFRDARPFEALRTAVLPELLRRRAAERRLAVWSAACASGQEPYSVALLLREHFPELAAWDVRLLATDICAAVLERARQGLYTQAEVNRGLPAALLVRYFRREGLDWQLDDAVRRTVELRRLNLVEPWPPLPAFDVVSLRNVLLYFDVPTRKQVLAAVRRALRPDGYLFLGGAETTLRLDDAFEWVPMARAGCYRLRDRPERTEA